MQLIFIFSKSFDIDMCPLPFTLEKMYCFISERFTDPTKYKKTMTEANGNL
jgi:hypothetical protein